MRFEKCGVLFGGLKLGSEWVDGEGSCVMCIYSGSRIEKK